MHTSFRFFIIPYLLLAGGVGASVFLLTKQGDTVLWLNDWHTRGLNVFFKTWTFGGDGIFFGIILLVLLIVRRRYGYIFALVGAVQGLVSAFMKRVWFRGAPRPKKYFEGKETLDLIAGVHIHDFNSFPSGHTMTAFAIATFLSLMIQRKDVSFILLFAAALVGISRMYLNQHFLVDVLVGSAIGVGIAWGFYLLFREYLAAS